MCSAPFQTFEPVDHFPQNWTFSIGARAITMYSNFVYSLVMMWRIQELLKRQLGLVNSAQRMQRQVFLWRLWKRPVRPNYVLFVLSQIMYLAVVWMLWRHKVLMVCVWCNQISLQPEVISPVRIFYLLIGVVPFNMVPCTSYTEPSDHSTIQSISLSVFFETWQVCLTVLLDSWRYLR